MDRNKSTRPVVIWLIAGAVLVAAMVVIGGVTRLTNSGLSMVEWKLIMGAVPPLSTQEWQATFDKYQQFPEYQQINKDYTLADFKSIFWWEYLHRLLGRLIGIVFLVPFIVFWVKGYFSRKWLWQLVILFVLGGFQGFLGWFMVKSGLVNNPDVSHFRLAAHLLAALLLFSYIIWLIIDIVNPAKSLIRIKTYNKILQILFFIVIIQIIYGAFVAGLNAGLFYPTFPKMGGEWMPESISNTYAAAGFISLFNDIATVQFIHRWLGMSILLMVVGIFYTYYPSLLTTGKKRLQLLLGAVLLQVLLGILTLLYAVPLMLAIAHQFTALLILTALVINLHDSRSGKSG
jgi:heme a synthase